MTTDTEAMLVASWVGMAITLLLDGADDRDVSMALAQQAKCDLRDLKQSHRDAPTLGKLLPAHEWADSD